VAGEAVPKGHKGLSPGSQPCDEKARSADEILAWAC